MKVKYLIASMALFAVLFASCSKNRYDLTHVHGVNAGGELLLPVASTSFTVADMMERFELTDMVNWTEAGDMSISFDFESDSIIMGSEFLKFDDLSANWHQSYVNPFPYELPVVLDTVVSFSEQFVFQSDNIRVTQAQMKSGRFVFNVTSNIGDVTHVVLRSSNIKDAQGNDFVLDVPVVDNSFSFDLDGLRYVTDNPNTINLSMDLRFNITGSTDPQLYFDVRLIGYDLGMHEMRGYVDAYSSHNFVDTTFTLFPNKLEGLMEVEGVKVRIKERNTFGIDARLVVDTTVLFNEGMPPCSILEPLPLTINIPHQDQFVEVFNRQINSRLNVSGGRVYLASTFTVNPENLSNLVSISDTDRIDTQIGIEVPFSFTLDDIVYKDTVDMNLSGLGTLDLIEQLTMEFAFASTLPLNLKASFYMYDSQSGRITDALLEDASLIEASFDGSPKTTNISLVIDDERIENVVHSDRIIMTYQLDTDDNNVNLNAKQKIDLSLKVKADYNIDVEF